MKKVISIVVAMLVLVWQIPTRALADDFSPDLASFYQQKLAWSKCPAAVQVPSKLAFRADCARVAVPIDYANPQGKKASLMLFRVRAAGKVIGSLLTNPGGPGGSGIEYGVSAFKRLANSRVGEHFNLIAFDPRGVGLSTPTVRCLTGKEQDEERAEKYIRPTPAGIKLMETKIRQDNQKCLQRSGYQLLANIGTTSVIRDMDIIRETVGDKKLNFLGYSYGTKLGSAYAEQFPQKVRALVLDGAVDPNNSVLETSIIQAKGFQKAFEDFARDCATKLYCPLGKDPSQAVNEYRKLLFPLADHPARTIKDGRVLSYSDAKLGVLTALYSKENWSILRLGLTQLKVGLGDILLMLADSYQGRNPDGTYSNMMDAFTAISCVDKVPVRNRALVNQAERMTEKLAPFMSDPGATGKAPLDSCAFWPVKNTSFPHKINAPGLPKVVVVSTTHDPATPYRSGVDLAKQLNASLVTYVGTQHTVTFNGNPCVDNAISDYFINLKSPRPGLVCKP